MGKIFELNGARIEIESEMKMKHLREIYPVIKNGAENEIELLYTLAETLFISIDGENDKNKFKNFIDNLGTKDLPTFSEEIMSVYQDKEKKST